MQIISLSHRDKRLFTPNSEDDVYQRIYIRKEIQQVPKEA